MPADEPRSVGAASPRWQLRIKSLCQSWWSRLVRHGVPFVGGDVRFGPHNYRVTKCRFDAS